MAQEKFSLPESTNRTQTHTITVSDLKEVTGISVNTGNVTIEKVDGKDITVKVSNGAYSRRVQTGGTYTPADSKTVTITANNVTQYSYFKFDGTSWKFSHETGGESYYYNKDGYSGTLTPNGKKSSPNTITYDYPENPSVGDVVLRGKVTWGTYEYSGTVTRPATDTRTWEYYYQYDVIVNYIANEPPSTPSYINVPSTVKSGSTFTISWGSSTDPDGDSVSYRVERSVNGGSYSQIYDGSNLNTSDTAQSSWNTVQYRVRAYDGEEYSGYRTSSSVSITHNSSPTLILDTTDNRTLYENDTLTISGNAKDEDVGNVVTVKYNINGGTTRAIATAISDGSNIPFNKTLIFKQNKLYDGGTAVTGDLAKGAQHTLKVWAEDDQGGKSEEQIRVFYVVPNRPAALTINPFSPREDLIDTDRITINGSISDPDNNTVKVSYKIANGSFKEVYNGTGGDFQFQVQLTELVEGTNTLTIQAEDSYGAKSVKTLQITKEKNGVPLKTAVARYKLSPPNGTAKGVILWIEREVGDLVVDVEISMGMNGEEENFVPMTKSSVAFVREGIEEDEWTYEADSPKENIIIKITMTRTSTNSNKGITLISGVLS